MLLRIEEFLDSADDIGANQMCLLVVEFDIGSLVHRIVAKRLIFDSVQVVQLIAEHCKNFVKDDCIGIW